MGCQYFDPCDHGADTFTIAIPKVTFGRGCLHEAGARASGLGMTRVAVFTDPFLREQRLCRYRAGLVKAGRARCRGFR